MTLLTALGIEVFAGLIILIITPVVTHFTNRKWFRNNIVTLIKEDKGLQQYLQNLSSGLKDKKILILQEPEDNNLIETLKEIPLFRDLQISTGSHHNIERIASNDLTIISTRVLRAAADRREDTFKEILGKKTAEQALIFFAPNGDESLNLSNEEMSQINSRSLISTTRMSGRLANDVLSLLSFLS